MVAAAFSLAPVHQTYLLEARQTGLRIESVHPIHLGRPVQQPAISPDGPATGPGEGLCLEQVLASHFCGKCKPAVVSSQQLLQGCFEVFSLAEPHFGSRQRMPIDDIYDHAGNTKLRRCALRAEMAHEKKNESDSSDAM